MSESKDQKPLAVPQFGGDTQQPMARLRQSIVASQEAAGLLVDAAERMSAAQREFEMALRRYVIATTGLPERSEPPSGVRAPCAAALSAEDVHHAIDAKGGDGERFNLFGIIRHPYVGSLRVEPPGRRTLVEWSGDDDDEPCRISGIGLIDRQSGSFKGSLRIERASKPPSQAAGQTPEPHPAPPQSRDGGSAPRRTRVVYP